MGEATYSTGTVSVGSNSTTVTGNGTAWASAGVRAGDMLVLAGLSVIVAEVTSNTSLTLTRAWPGGAQSGADYDLVLFDDNVRSLVALNELLSTYQSGNVAALAGLSGASNKLPYFTGSGAMDLTDVTAAARRLLATGLLDVSGGKIAGAGVVSGGGDSTPDRLLKTASGGILGPAPFPKSPVDGDMDLLETGGMWSLSGEWSNGPDGPSSQIYTGTCLVIRRGFDAGAAVTQIVSYGGASGNKLVVRTGTGDPLSWEPWDVLYHSSNAPVRETEIFMAANSVADIPCPRNAGMALIICGPDSGFPTLSRSGLFLYDVGNTPQVSGIHLGGNFAISQDTEMTGTTGTLGTVTASTYPGDGNIHLENGNDESESFRILAF